jgi:hypothetical protein
VIAEIRLQFSGLAINHESLTNDLKSGLHQDKYISSRRLKESAEIESLLDENGELKAVNKAKVLLDELRNAYHRGEFIYSWHNVHILMRL